MGGFVGGCGEARVCASVLWGVGPDSGEGVVGRGVPDICDAVGERWGGGCQPLR